MREVIEVKCERCGIVRQDVVDDSDVRKCSKCGGYATYVRTVELTTVRPQPKPQPRPQDSRPGPTQDTGRSTGTITRTNPVNTLLLSDKQRAMQFAVALSEKLYRDYAIAKHAPTVWRNLQGAYTHQTKSGAQVVIGYQWLDWAWLNGWTEYKTIWHVWPVRSAKGPEVAFRVVLHEFAHVLQLQAANERTYGSCHNEYFVQHLCELIELYDFEAEWNEFLRCGTL